MTVNFDKTKKVCLKSRIIHLKLLTISRRKCNIIIALSVIDYRNKLHLEEKTFMKKTLAVILSLMLMLGFIVGMASCDKKPGPTPGGDTTDLSGTYDITVWVSELAGVKELTQEQIAAFAAANPGIVINATVEGVSEGESATQMVTSVEDGADIFCFAQDQLARLVMAGALNKLGQATATEVTNMNDAGAVAAASVGGSLYCFPLTSDNGYFMFYDKSVVSADHIDSLEDIIADCEKAGMMFSFELEGSAWYNSSFFFATGCKSVWTTDLAGNFTAVDDTFNSDNGVIALKGMQKLLKSKCYNNSSAHADFSAAVPSAVVVSGAWGTQIAQEALGENFAAADLPSFEVDGKSYHLGSYSGNKLLGVKPQTDAKKAAVLQKLALYLTGESCQTERFTKFGWGPSNKNAQGTDAVKKDVALSALAAQSQYARPQGQIHGSWWDIGKVYATTAKTATTDGELKDALSLYETTIKGLLSMPLDEKEAFTVIGKFLTYNWDTDVAMTQKPEGTWYSDVLALKAGDELQVRQGKAWDVQFGAVGEDGNSTKSNIVVAEDGYYFVKLVFDKAAGTGVVTLEKSSPVTGFTVIGDIGGDTWSKDLPMEIQKDGTWLSVEAYTFAEGTQFKVRRGLSWDEAYGAGTENFVCDKAGTFKVKLTLTETSGTVELIPVS